jgi:3-methyladenine DNA glycosylase AlkD
MVQQIISEVLTYSEPDRIHLYKKYFQCFPGGYGAGNEFAGIRSPILRSLAKKYKYLSTSEAKQLITNNIHEIRLLALHIFELKFKSKKTSENEKQEIISLYLTHLEYINNWDLVDSSAHFLLGEYTLNTNKSILVDLAHSNHLWSNRIAIITTLHHIRKNSFSTTFEIAEILLHHPHDLIHKAVGWMLREVGNKNMQAELDFLKKHYNNMPRTMLRYAIEKFDEPLRLQFLKGTYQ